MIIRGRLKIAIPPQFRVTSRSHAQRVLHTLALLRAHPSFPTGVLILTLTLFRTQLWDVFAAPFRAGSHRPPALFIGNHGESYLFPVMAFRETRVQVTTHFYSSQALFSDVINYNNIKDLLRAYSFIAIFGFLDFRYMTNLLPMTCTGSAWTAAHKAPQASLALS